MTGVCGWEVEPTPYSYNGQTEKHTYSYDLNLFM